METAVSKCKRIKTKSTGYHGKHEPGGVKRTNCNPSLFQASGLNIHYTCNYVCLPPGQHFQSASVFCSFLLVSKIASKSSEDLTIMFLLFLVEEGWLLALPVLLDNHVAAGRCVTWILHLLTCTLDHCVHLPYSWRDHTAYHSDIQTSACKGITWRAC